MVQVLKMISELVNKVHDVVMSLTSRLGYNFTDKQLHFIIVGIIGMVIFIISDYIFVRLAKYSVSVISFIYTCTVLIVIVFAIEIEQKITHRGNMEFKDITAGLWGFFEFFTAYVILRGMIFLGKRVFSTTITKLRSDK